MPAPAAQPRFTPPGIVLPPAPQPMDQGPEQTIWCRADRDPFSGQYLLTVSYDDDHVLALNGDGLHQYAATLTAALMRGRYVEAVRRQFASIGLPEDVALPTIQQFREELPELPEFDTFRIEPIVSYEGRVSVMISQDGKRVAQLLPRNVREHIVHAYQVYAAADLDAAYARFARGVIGIDAGRAAAMVGTLTPFYPDDEQ